MCLLAALMAAMDMDLAVQTISALATPELMELLLGPSLIVREELAQLEPHGLGTSPTPTMPTLSLNAPTRASATERLVNAHASPTTTVSHASAQSAPTHAAMPVSASHKDSLLLRLDALTPHLGMLTCTLDAYAILGAVAPTALSWNAHQVLMS